MNKKELGERDICTKFITPSLRDELTAFLDQLEAHLKTAQTERCRLLESVLHHALAGAWLWTRSGTTLSDRRDPEESHSLRQANAGVEKRGFRNAVGDPRSG